MNPREVTKVYKIISNIQTIKDIDYILSIAQKQKEIIQGVSALSFMKDNGDIHIEYSGGYTRIIKAKKPRETLFSNPHYPK